MSIIIDRFVIPSFLSKIVEKYVSMQLISHLEVNSSIYPDNSQGSGSFNPQSLS